MKTSPIILIILLITGCAWTPEQKVKLGVITAEHAFDMYCTYGYVRDGNEAWNGVYADMKPSEAIGSMVITGGLYFLVANWLDKYRDAWLWGGMAGKTAITINNLEYGIP